MKDLIDRDKLFEKITSLYRYSKGETREVYKAILDYILDMKSETLSNTSTISSCSSWESSDHYAVCNGTKEREMCHCGGDVTKCDFYPNKRGELE